MKDRLWTAFYGGMRLRFARQTEVATDRSKAEIERLLMKAGAEEFAQLSSRGKAAIMFTMAGRRYRFMVPLPDPEAKEFRFTGRRQKRRSDADTYRSWEQACRQKWRALALAIKARLIAVEEGIDTFEEAFLSKMVIPSSNGQTVGECLIPQLDSVYSGKAMPKLLELAHSTGN